MSDEFKDESDESFIHYTPQHPLPQEIRTLSRDKTICKYCGVSYLIHNEIKALEQKLKATEQELSHFKGLEKREALLQQEISLLKQQLEQSRSTSETNTKLLSMVTKEKEDLKLQNKECEEKIQAFRQKDFNNLRQLSNLNQSFKQCKQDLMIIKDKFIDIKEEMLCSLPKVLKSTFQISEGYAKEKETFESKLQCVDMEKLVISQSNKSLSENLKAMELDLLKNLEELRLKNLELDNQVKAYKTLESSMKDVTDQLQLMKEIEKVHAASNKDLEESHTQCKILAVELDQYKLHLKSKTSELNELNSKLKLIQQNHEQAIEKLNNEIKCKDSKLETNTELIKSLETQCQELWKREKDIAQSSKTSANEVQDLKEELKNAKNDANALKSEREMMIEAHQKRIEDLRESFKNKMVEAEGWPQKLQGAVVAERSRHLSELKTLEENLKDQFVLELQIEKDKYDELLKKFQAQEKERNTAKDNYRTQNEQKYKDEIEDLIRKVTESKRRASEREDELNKEISSLKKIINDLQDRSAKLEGTDSGKVSELQNQLAEIHQEHLDAMSTITLLQGKLKEKTEEAQFLQGIVRKECEERFELTEALSEARRELLQLKKPLGGYSSVQKRGSVSSVNSGGSTLSNTPVTLVPIDNSSGLRSRASIQSYHGPSSNHGDNVKLQSADGGHIDESRKKILSVMGRR